MPFGASGIIRKYEQFGILKVEVSYSMGRSEYLVPVSEIQKLEYEGPWWGSRRVPAWVVHDAPSPPHIEGTGRYLGGESAANPQQR